MLYMACGCLRDGFRQLIAITQPSSPTSIYPTLKELRRNSFARLTLTFPLQQLTLRPMFAADYKGLLVIHPLKRDLAKERKYIAAAGCLDSDVATYTSYNKQAYTCHLYTHTHTHTI